MYCIKCGKEINENSKFCGFCGTKVPIGKKINKTVEKVNIENDDDKVYVWTCDYCKEEFKTKFESDEHEKICESNLKKYEQKYSKTEDKNNLNNNKGLKPGLNGWLALIGLGLIIAIAKTVYGLFDYFPLFAENWDYIPGFLTLLQFEFLALIAFIVFYCYTLYLYFKKNIKFPKIYIILSITLIIYGILDYLIASSFPFPNQEIQKTFNDSLSDSGSEIFQNVISGIIWIFYMKKSKRVKLTFVEE